MRKFQILLMSLLFVAGSFAQTEKVDTVSQINESVAITTLDSESKIVESLTGAVDKIIDTRIGEMNQERGPMTKLLSATLFLSVVLPLFIIFLAIVLMNYFNNRAKKQRDLLRHEIYMKALETGQALPEKIFEELGSAKPAEKSSLSSALVMLGLGIAFLFIGYITGNGGLYFASIVGFIGLGRLVAWIIERPKEEKSESNE